ncbi:TonB-dependent receptor [Oleiagrimonas soli]|uniref:TonB-dependent receptor-like beta-barrel domain-containing protein n=1 Tax=Oleiagrimonas soli TaxID=1543381 RepID=A0A099CZX7_9GAMM|nr:TonB-dependent receptor [Oleiagrimonas soli]KGI78530.1 hypothetical protein LF63_0103425 [Oleiagrimonas soli]MBB6184201.1 hypothetical protein [Oleiagrimonas soli]
MRKWLTSLLMFVPLIAAGQTLDGVSPTQAAAEHVAAYRSLQRVDGQGNMLLPLWRDADGRMLALVGSSDSAQDNTPGALDFRVVDVSQSYSSGLRYDLGPHVAAYAQLAQRNWLMPAASRTCTPADGVGCPDASTLNAARLLSGEVGASYSGSGYRFDVMFNGSRANTQTSPLLPRVLPQSPTASIPLWSLDSSTNFAARGRVALGSETGIDLGASVGKIRLLPGNLLGVSALGQQSLSLGVDSGPLSGRITGRMLQPVPGSGDTQLMGPERHWTTIDLGVTWRLPWQGELRFGAQNLWSSGQAPVPVEGPEPDRSRIPYVQYHQDL